MEATSLASGANGKGKAVELGEGPPLNMLPACLATHRAARRPLVNDDAVAAGSAAVLGPLALPAWPRRDHASLDLGVLGLAPQGDQLRIALARLDDQHPIAVDEGSGCGCGPRCQRNRHCVTLLPGPSARASCWRFRARLGVGRLPPSARRVSASA